MKQWVNPYDGSGRVVHPDGTVTIDGLNMTPIPVELPPPVPARIEQRLEQKARWCSSMPPGNYAGARQ